MEKLRLQGYGRTVVNGKWYIDTNYVVNRLYFVNSGTARIYSGGVERNLTAGKIYIIPKCNNFKPLSAENFDHTFFDYYSTQLLPADTVIELNSSENFFDGFFIFLNSIIKSDSNRQNTEAIEHFLCGFLSVVKQYNSMYITNAFIENAIEIIDKDYSTVTTKFLSRSLNLDESYFIRLFKSTMGISPMKYIRRCKVINGKRFLSMGESVEKVSERCGYASAASFYKAVKEEFGVSPSQLKSEMHINSR